VRATERGYFKDEFSPRRVWTTQNGEQPVEEWLVMRRDGEDKIHHALLNEPAEATLERLAWGKCQRVFVKCANRDSKVKSAGMNCEPRNFTPESTNWPWSAWRPGL
jgi:hypothetical protein